jgi:hypothetical protein
MKMTTIRIGGANIPVLEIGGANIPVLEFLYNNYICAYQLQGYKCTKLQFEFLTTFQVTLF